MIIFRSGGRKDGTEKKILLEFIHTITLILPLNY